MTLLDCYITSDSQAVKGDKPGGLRVPKSIFE
eukprot:jgi/Botrbrau1/21889/Bobra.0249s0018.1